MKCGPTFCQCAAAGALLLSALSVIAQAQPDRPKFDTIMTAQAARELFQSVDEIMTFASKDSGLAPVLKVKRRLETRDEVNRYLIKNFDEDESAKRLERSEIVLKKFGLLDRDFHLRPFLLTLLTEQIAGFYDSKTKTVNLLNWVEPEEQKPVLAHELTHALQDQKVGLEKWSSTGFHGVSRTASEDNQRLAVDEVETARQAVTEGQAMVVFVDYGLKGTGKTVEDSPDLGKQMKEGAAQAGGSSVMARAPLLLQRSLQFPYTDGLTFEQALLEQKGRAVAFAGTLAAPPRSSFEIMHPDAYLAHASVPVLLLPDVHALTNAEYEPYDLGVMGELDVEIMATLFGGQALGTALAPAWDGGVYYAAQRRSATPAERMTPGSLAVFYASRWKTEKAARAFAQVYRGELGRKYVGLIERKKDEHDGDEQVYTTQEGDVLLSLSGKTLFIAEGFPMTLARKLNTAVQSVQGTGPLRQAMTPTHELTFSTAQTLGGYGLMKVALRPAKP